MVFLNKTSNLCMKMGFNVMECELLIHSIKSLILSTSELGGLSSQMGLFCMKFVLFT